MLKSRSLAVLLITLIAACASATQPDMKLNALLISGQMNPYHNIETMDRVITQYLEATGLFDVTQVSTPKAGEDMSSFAPDFSQYDLVVLNYDGDLWSAATRQAFEQYMLDGGGLVSVHSSDNAFAQWQAFLDMTGVGGWNGRDETWGPAIRWGDTGMELYSGPGEATHPPPHNFAVTTRDQTHPITAGMPSTWLHANDELYTSLRGPARNVTLLATGFADPALQNASGQHEPVLLAIRYGKGRVFHTTLGHIAKHETEPPESVRCVGFMTTLQRGSEWAATGHVTQPLPDALPGPTSTLLR